MLQQTPVARVDPVHRAWLETWPTPADLAAAPSGEAVRAWGRLGYPRRALRLHAAATAIVERYGGEVPSAYDDLRALPGVGDYTAAAIATFGFGRRHAVLDTNVRRVLARLVSGAELPPVAATAAEKRLAEDLLPDDEADAAVWSIALMELGALVCTATKPRCEVCPVAERCAWRAAGYPAYDGPPRKAQTWAGSDRQCRGALLAVVRDAEESVPKTRLAQAWHDPTQRDRCLASLLTDGLLVQLPGGETYALPGSPVHSSGPSRRLTTRLHGTTPKISGEGGRGGRGPR
jgi:A/G-specific adenine glycosylase